MDETSTLKQRILDAAIHEFGVNGYHLTSLRTIAERTGSNKPMIYYHFQGKDGLYLAAVRHLLEELGAHVREAVEIEAPAVVRLSRFAEVYLDAFLISRPMMGTVLRELNGLVTTLYDTIADEHAALVTVHLRRILVAGVEGGEFRRLSIDECIGGITALLHGFVRHRRVSPQHARRAALSQLMDHYALGLLVPASGASIAVVRAASGRSS